MSFNAKLKILLIETFNYRYLMNYEDWKQKYEAEAGEPIGMGFKKQKKPQLHISRYMIHPDEIKVDVNGVMANRFKVVLNPNCPALFKPHAYNELE